MLCSLAACVARADNPPSPDTVGAIIGDSIAVQGPMSVDFTDGQARTILRSGSDIQVKSGTAHIDLVEGGNITICGPAHFSVLKSAGALTIALDSGTIHVHVDAQPTLTIYTDPASGRRLDHERPTGISADHRQPLHLRTATHHEARSRSFH